jgi:hypothetical protein
MTTRFDPNRDTTSSKVCMQRGARARVLPIGRRADSSIDYEHICPTSAEIPVHVLMVHHCGFKHGIENRDRTFYFNLTVL